ncbi:MAG: hypothetical protein LW850_10405 [Planctomycetaceae bacterium]|nr:hypothetical protein [Planctomycetaceae bacterium]
MKLNPAWFSAPLALALSPLLWNSETVAQYDSNSLDPLLLEYANSNDQRKKQISEQITKSVQLQFDQRHTAQQQEIKWLEDQLAAKKKAFDKRESLKEKIVNDRVASLIQRADGIGWEPLLPSTPPNPFPPATHFLASYLPSETCSQPLPRAVPNHPHTPKPGSVTRTSKNSSLKSNPTAMSAS